MNCLQVVPLMREELSESCIPLWLVRIGVDLLNKQVAVVDDVLSFLSNTVRNNLIS
jgi:hypothetical protein